MQEKELYLLRHGDTGFKNHYIGSSDVPLSQKGIAEAKSVCTVLSDITFETIICSPMKRCKETVSYLTTTQPIEYLDFLKEIDFGRWEKKTFKEICTFDQCQVDSWVSDSDNFTFPEGESVADFQNRITLAKAYLEQSEAKRILVVCHGGVIRHLLCRLLRVPQSQYLLYDISYGSLTTVRLYSSGGVLTGLNLTPARGKSG